MRADHLENLMRQWNGDAAAMAARAVSSYGVARAATARSVAAWMAGLVASFDERYSQLLRAKLQRKVRRRCCAGCQLLAADNHPYLLCLTPAP